MTCEKCFLALLPAVTYGDEGLCLQTEVPRYRLRWMRADSLTSVQNWMEINSGQMPNSRRR